MRLLLIILSVYATLEYRVILASGKAYLPSTVHEIQCLDGETLQGSMTWKTDLNNKINLHLYLFKEGSTMAQRYFTSSSFQKQQFTFQISGAGKYIMKPIIYSSTNQTAEYQIALVKAGVNYSFSGTLKKQFDTYLINGTNQAGVYENINLKIQIPSPYYLGLSVDFLDQGKTKYSNIFNTYNAYRTQNFDVGKLQCSGNMSFRLKWIESPILSSRLISYNFTVSYEVPDSPAPSQNYSLLLKGVHTFPNYFYKIQCQQGEILKGIVHWSQRIDLNVEYYEEGQRQNWTPQLEFRSTSKENETIELLVNKTGTQYFKVKELVTSYLLSVPFEIQLSCGNRSVQNSGFFYKNYKQTNLFFESPNSGTCYYRLTYTKLSNMVSTLAENFYLKVNLQIRTSVFLGPSQTSNEGVSFDFAIQKDPMYQVLEFREGLSSNSEYFQYQFKLEHPSNQVGCQQELIYPTNHYIDQDSEEIDKNNMQYEKGSNNGDIGIYVGFAIGGACFLTTFCLCFKYHKRIFSRVKPNEQVSREHLHEISEQDVCSICLDLGLNGSLPCGHNFHLGCIMSWLAKNQHCPNCRVECRIADVRSRISS